MDDKLEGFLKNLIPEFESELAPILAKRNELVKQFDELINSKYSETLAV